MRKIGYILSAVMAFTVASVTAQNCETGVSIAVTEDSGMSAAAVDFLDSRMHQLASNSDISIIEGGNLVILPKMLSVAKDILPGPPAKVSEEFELTLYMVDVNTGSVYASQSFTLRGIADAEPKCEIAAIKQIKPDNDKLKGFFATGKKKALDYYDNNSAMIIKKAETFAGMKNYGAALFTVFSIPQCSKGYVAAVECAEKIYQKYVDDMCEKNLALARMAWAAKQNSEGAEDAGSYLAQIYPEAKCYGDAMALYKEIKGKVLDDIKFEMKKYQDGVDIEKQKINAIKEIGVAYGKGQQPVTTNIIGLGRR